MYLNRLLIWTINFRIKDMSNISEVQTCAFFLGIRTRSETERPKVQQYNHLSNQIIFTPFQNTENKIRRRVTIIKYQG